MTLNRRRFGGKPEAEPKTEVKFTKVPEDKTDSSSQELGDALDSLNQTEKAELGH